MGCWRQPDRLAVAAATLVLASLLLLPAARVPFVDGLVRLADVPPAALATAGAALLVAQASAALAWRAALRARDTAVPIRAALGCYGAGSLANSLLPGGVGDALRIELFARASGRDARWLCGGVCAGIGLGRGIVFSALLAGAVAGGLVPGAVLLAPLCGAAAVVVATLVMRRRTGRRLGQLASGASSVGPSVLGWLGLVLALRFGGAAYLLHALAVDKPMRDAILLLVALGAAGAVTLTPGNVGVASAAVAIALVHAGVEPGAAAAAGIAYHALETAAGLGFGAFGAALRAASRRRAAQPAASPAAVEASAG